MTFRVLSTNSRKIDPAVLNKCPIGYTELEMKKIEAPTVNYDCWGVIRIFEQ